MSDTPAKVLVYSDDRTVREQVRLALGRRVAVDLPEIEVFEVATQAAVLRTLDAGTDYALLILDGNAQPSGGFGVAHQIKEEYADSAPVLLLVNRDPAPCRFTPPAGAWRLQFDSDQPDGHPASTDTLAPAHVDCPGRTLRVLVDDPTCGGVS